jgi:hypothetical protein
LLLSASNVLSNRTTWYGAFGSSTLNSTTRSSYSALGEKSFSHAGNSASNSRGSTRRKRVAVTDFTQLTDCMNKHNGRNPPYSCNITITPSTDKANRRTTNIRRTTDFPSLHLSLSPSLHLPLSPSPPLSISPSLHLSISPNLTPSRSDSNCRSPNPAPCRRTPRVPPRSKKRPADRDGC